MHMPSSSALPAQNILKSHDIVHVTVPVENYDEIKNICAMHHLDEVEVGGFAETGHAGVCCRNGGMLVCCRDEGVLASWGAHVHAALTNTTYHTLPFESVQAQ